VYFGSDEHEWAFLSGLAEANEDPVAAMSARLATLPYTPLTIDADSLIASTIPPKTLRFSAADAKSRAGSPG
jgi:ornithine decarboxylase